MTLIFMSLTISWDSIASLQSSSASPITTVVPSILVSSPNSTLSILKCFLVKLLTTSSSTLFSVEEDGDVNLTGSVTGGSSNSGYRLDKNGSGYIRRGNYGIYFESNNYPIYISNQANSGSNASFAVDKDGNLNLRGSNIYINGDMKFNSGSLSNYVTDSELNNALSNIDTSIDSEDFKSNLRQLIDSS